ncbi:hypothetical protein RRH01S_08_00820 [Rhizobium rhizogenes NBRC 13257]|uniref:Uncharacterized protein n=1 Tax=Rhizobium rhizogenes NBRC 13257 TaxID=1220581 RepID=A0AA87U5U9_RHIRH|nr:hypothetical protein RRH01S_08_00820 [Rhizobium rhizogenes NBRC 13257]
MGALSRLYRIDVAKAELRFDGRDDRANDGRSIEDKPSSGRICGVGNRVRSINVFKARFFAIG